MKMKLKKHWTDEKTTLQKLSTALIWDDDKVNQLKIVLSNTFQAPQDLHKEGDINTVNN